MEIWIADNHGMEESVSISEVSCMMCIREAKRIVSNFRGPTLEESYD